MFLIAENLVQDYFKNKLDKGGHPYLEHLIYVSSKGRNEEEKLLGLLHDILEDTEITKREMLNLGFRSEFIQKLELLTHKKEEPYEQYIERIIKSHCLEALYIKKVDMEHNMDLTRISHVTQKDIKRVEEKYKPSYQKICQALENL